MTLRANRLARSTTGLEARIADAAGQTTAEYALVILGAAAVATLLIAWATNSGAVSDLFDKVVEKILP